MSKKKKKKLKKSAFTTNKEGELLNVLHKNSRGGVNLQSSRILLNNVIESRIENEKETTDPETEREKLMKKDTELKRINSKMKAVQNKFQELFEQTKNEEE